MFNLVALATVCVGQVFYSPPAVCETPMLVQSVVVTPSTHVFIYGITERTREYKIVPYKNGRQIKVPVINGYVPSIRHTRYVDGSERIVYDYRINKTYKQVMAEWRVKWEKDRVKKSTSVMVPLPEAKPQLAPSKMKPEMKLEPPQNAPKPESPKPVAPPKLEDGLLQPVPPMQGEPRVIIPPTYRDE